MTVTQEELRLWNKIMGLTINAKIKMTIDKEAKALQNVPEQNVFVFIIHPSSKTQGFNYIDTTNSWKFRVVNFSLILEDFRLIWDLCIDSKGMT